MMILGLVIQARKRKSDLLKEEPEEGTVALIISYYILCIKRYILYRLGNLL